MQGIEIAEKFIRAAFQNVVGRRRNVAQSGVPGTHVRGNGCAVPQARMEIRCRYGGFRDGRQSGAR